MATLALSSSTSTTGTQLCRLGNVLSALGSENQGDKFLDGTITITDNPLKVVVSGRNNSAANITIQVN